MNALVVVGGGIRWTDKKEQKNEVVYCLVKEGRREFLSRAQTFFTKPVFVK